MLRTGVIFVLGYSRDSLMLCRGAVRKKRGLSKASSERETGVEPATLSLGS